MSKSLSGWREIVIERDDYRCVACSARHKVYVNTWLEAHHVHYKSLGGVADDPRNGTMLCKPHHDEVHARSLLLSPDMLRLETLEYLAEAKAVDWDDNGEPFGLMFKGFTNKERG